MNNMNHINIWFDNLINLMLIISTPTKNEEAHVSRKKLKHGEKVELLVKVELVSSTFSSLINIFVFNYLGKVEF